MLPFLLKKSTWFHEKTARTKDDMWLSLFFLFSFSLFSWYCFIFTYVFFCISAKVLWESFSTIGSFWCFVQRVYFYLMLLEWPSKFPKEEKSSFFVCLFFPNWITNIKTCNVTRASKHLGNFSWHNSKDIIL